MESEAEKPRTEEMEAESEQAEQSSYWIKWIKVRNQKEIKKDVIFRQKVKFGKKT